MIACRYVLRRSNGGMPWLPKSRSELCDSYGKVLLMTNPGTYTRLTKEV